MYQLRKFVGHRFVFDYHNRCNYKICDIIYRVDFCGAYYLNRMVGDYLGIFIGIQDNYVKFILNIKFDKKIEYGICFRPNYSNIYVRSMLINCFSKAPSHRIYLEPPNRF